jgi:predicted RNase H-like nuclease (RuvC/YqgF family)
MSEDYKTYTTKEAAEIVGIKERAIQTRCKRENVRKKDNKYLITDSLISIWRKKEEANAKVNAKQTQNATQTQLDLEIEALKLENETLKKNLDSSEKELNLSDIEIKNLKKQVAELKEELSVEIPHKEKLRQAIQMVTLEAMEQGVTHKIFTEEEYEDIIGTISEVDFQKEQVEYLRTRVEKQDSILQELVQQTTQRNFIEAKDKGFDKK